MHHKGTKAKQLHVAVKAAKAPLPGQHAQNLHVLRRFGGGRRRGAGEDRGLGDTADGIEDFRGRIRDCQKVVRMSCTTWNRQKTLHSEIRNLYTSYTNP